MALDERRAAGETKGVDRLALGARRWKVMTVRRILVSACLAAALAWPLAPTPAAWASEDEKEDPRELARDGMERMLRAIELMIEMIPQYEMPEVNENGDIIIRRKNPPPGDDEEAEEPVIDETKT